MLAGATNAVFKLPADAPKPDLTLKLGAWSVAVAPGSRRVYLAHPDDRGVSVVEVEK